MIALMVDGYTLGAIALIGFVVIVLAAFAVRLMRDHGVRVAKIGVYIERERIGASKHDKPDVHHVDPGDEETKIEWPQREEGP